MVCEGSNWIEQVQEKVQKQDFECGHEPPSLTYAETIFSRRVIINFSRKILTHGGS
jgi:hypothetical protein